jgi:hypothetical protein
VGTAGGDGEWLSEPTGVLSCAWKGTRETGGRAAIGPPSACHSHLLPANCLSFSHGCSAKYCDSF